MARSQSQAAREFFIGMLQGERAALEKLEDFGMTAGLSADQFLAT